MSHAALIAIACCCGSGETDCYCGTLCVGCTETDPDPCAPDPLPTACVSMAAWATHFDGLPGTGSGALIPINGAVYFFDGTTSPCVDRAVGDEIDWESATKADECPETCPHESAIITWSGSATYAGACCYDSFTDTSTYTNTWTATHTLKTSDPISLSIDGLCVGSAVETTDIEYISDIGSACPGNPTLAEDPTTINYRLSFALERDTTDCVWRITVSSSAVLGGLTTTAWSLTFEAPLSLCPPIAGWTLNGAASTYPIAVMDPDCSDLGGGVTANPTVTAFTEGSVSIAFV